ncbi:LysR substrate-binding domain-containing protein [Serratia marcescens]
MIKVRQLEAFNAVMLAGTVTGAAARLRISQPAISELVAGLEEQLGFALFFRERNRLQATDEARYFYKAVTAALESLAGIERLAADIRDASAGTLRVAALPMLALDFLPRVIARFLKENEGVNVVLQARSSPTVVSLITTQQFDVGLAESEYDLGWVDAERLRLRCVCVLPEGHALARKRRIGPTDLDGLPIVTAPRDHIRTRRLQEIFAACGSTLSFKVETPLFASMCAFVAEGFGYSIVDPVTARHFEGRGLVSRPFDPPFFTDFAMLHPAGKPRSLIAQAFGRHVLRELEAFGLGTQECAQEQSGEQVQDQEDAQEQAHKRAASSRGRTGRNY